MRLTQPSQISIDKYHNKTHSFDVLPDEHCKSFAVKLLGAKSPRPLTERTTGH